MWPVVIFATMAVASGSNHTPTVLTSCGPVVGAPSADNENIVSYLGIPYAMPPVHELRWQPPVDNFPHHCWSGPLVANETGPACPQRGSMAMSEDCLRLHVWTPATQDNASQHEHEKKKLLPVIVYLHGGSLVEGSAVVRFGGWLTAEANPKPFLLLLLKILRDGF